MPRWTFLMATAALAVVAAACGSDGSDPSSGSSSTTRPATSSTSSTSTTSTTIAPVEGTTDWVDVTAAWKALAPQAFAVGPEQVAEDLAALRRGQDTGSVGMVEVASVQRGEPLVITLAETGGADDAVVRVETEITLEPGDEGWVVSKARQRSTCRSAPPAGATACS